jgi:hypothetical protein
VSSPAAVSTTPIPTPTTSPASAGSRLRCGCTKNVRRRRNQTSRDRLDFVNDITGGERAQWISRAGRLSSLNASPQVGLNVSNRRRSSPGRLKIESPLLLRTVYLAQVLALRQSSERDAFQGGEGQLLQNQRFSSWHGYFHVSHYIPIIVTVCNLEGAPPKKVPMKWLQNGLGLADAGGWE